MEQKTRTPIAYHLAMQARFPHVPNKDRERCVRVWQEMRRRFTGVVAAVIMPDHLHLIHYSTETSMELELKWIQLRRWLNFQGMVWVKSGPPVPIPNRHHLKRQVRYVHLNPCRDRLCTDPLQWEWSTHREYLGGVIDPWVDVGRALDVMGLAKTEAGLRGFHKYVSSDPSADVSGTRFPPSEKNQSIWFLNLEAAEAALVLAFRAPKDALRKKGPLRRAAIHAIGCAFDGRKRAIAKHFGVHPAMLSRKRPESRGWQRYGVVLRRVLSDARFLWPLIGRDERAATNVALAVS